MTDSKKMLASKIDHTLLKPTATQEQYLKLCQQAQDYKLFSVCVPAFFVPLATQKLSGSSVCVCSVVGFPLGYEATEAKTVQTQLAIRQGAKEVDMVINLAALKSQQWSVVQEDIQKVVQVASGKIVKVILETCYLSHEEIIKACEISLKAGAHFVKTSTGFGSGGATLEQIKLMKSVVGQSAQVKASGGISNFKAAMAMIEAGADRLGTSQSVNILNQADT